MEKPFDFTVDPSASFTVESMISTLAANCDGAVAEDGAGFNKPDSPWGKAMAMAVEFGMALDWDQARRALVMLRKYQKQLGGKEFMDGFLSNPIFTRHPVGEMDFEPRVARLRNDVVILDFPYNMSVIDGVKAMPVQYRERFFDRDTKCWKVVLNAATKTAILDFCKKFKFNVEQGIIDYDVSQNSKVANGNVPGAVVAPVTDRDKLICVPGVPEVTFKFKYNPAIIASIKTIRGKDRRSNQFFSPKYDAAAKTWSVAVCEDSIEMIMEVARTFNFEVDPHIQGYYNRVMQKMQAISRALQQNSGFNAALVRDGVIAIVAENIPDTLKEALAGLIIE